MTFLLRHCRAVRAMGAGAAHGKHGAASHQWRASQQWHCRRQRCVQMRAATPCLKPHLLAVLGVRHKAVRLGDAVAIPQRCRVSAGREKPG